ncbi:MAG: hypothetical protein KIT18_15180, partial [Burkholderiales bacterium]|nr:hypothetical protein [Burkholderiales bacterium]
SMKATGHGWRIHAVGHHPGSTLDAGTAVREIFRRPWKTWLECRAPMKKRRMSHAPFFYCRVESLQASNGVNSVFPPAATVHC